MMATSLSDQFSEIRRFSEWRKIEPLNKGWSSDEKFYIETQNGEKLLLRVNSIQNEAAKREEFAAMQQVARLPLVMSNPLEFGRFNRQQNVYTLLLWVEGSALDEVLPDFLADEQRELGKQAGRILKLMHAIPAPANQINWATRMQKKMLRHRERYLNCGIRISNDEMALAYVDQNLHLLEERTQTFQHGDFHVGNLILTPESQIGVIDFNRWDYGDSAEEFYKMMLFSREVSIPFVVGQLEGYFDGEVPADFWPLLALYLADVILFSIVWAQSFGQQEVDGMIRRAQMILADFDQFESVVPNWYF